MLENELLIPPPSSVLKSFWRLATSGQLNKHFAATLIEFSYGFGAATIIGIVVGYFMGMHRWFDEIMDPRIATLYSIPIHHCGSLDYYLVRYRHGFQSGCGLQNYRCRHHSEYRCRHQKFGPRLARISQIAAPEPLGNNL